MGTQCLHLLVLVVAVTFYHLPPTTATATTTSIHRGATAFILTTCNTTLYPDLCYSSLSPYAHTIKQNTGRLARAAIAVTLSKAHRMASYVSSLSREANFSADSGAASALRDCFTNLGDAVDNIRDSLKQMRQMGAVKAGGEQFRFEMSNVQTWMSAALTDQETCTDGFEGVQEGKVKTNVCDRVTYVKKLTSNALAMVNIHANKGTP